MSFGSMPDIIKNQTTDGSTASVSVENKRSFRFDYQKVGSGTCTLTFWGSTSGDVSDSDKVWYILDADVGTQTFNLPAGEDVGYAATLTNSGHRYVKAVITNESGDFNLSVQMGAIND